MIRTLQIAMVEDTASDRKWLTDKLDNYLRSRHIPYTLSSFTSGEEFLLALPNCWFDIVFMDIYMKEITGLEAAQALRARDRDCKLIFLTSSEEYMRQGFSLNSAHYLIKPVKDKDFLQAMENCRIRRNCQVPWLSIISDRAAIEINTLDILYIDIEKRTVMIHTKNKILSASRTFGKLTEPLMSDERFLLCNKGLLVNMDYIAALEDYDFVLTNGERLPVAPRRKRELMSRYHSYTFGTLGD